MVKGNKMSEQLQENISKAQSYLKRFKDEITGHFINGKKTTGDSGKTFDNLSPVDNSSLGQIAEGSVNDIDQACQTLRALE